MKKFKSKKHIKIKYKKILLTLISTLITIIILRTILSLKIFKLNPVKTLDYSNIYTTKNIKKEITQLITQITRIDINKPTTILKQMIPYEQPNIETKKYIVKKQKTDAQEPLIYI